LRVRNLGIINRPGDELIVYEVTGTKPFKMAVWNSTDSAYRPVILFTTAPTEQQNRCGEKVNAGRIDLSDFGIANCTSIFRIWVDNIGAPGCCNGSDISGISDTAFVEKPEAIVQDHGKAPKNSLFF
jgi:hypothetical protein